MKKLFAATGAALVLLLLMFDVDVDFRFSLPRTERALDAEQEALYDDCVVQADREVHAETFAEVDNPDVQREWLYRRMEAAKAECRSTYPQRHVDVEHPLEFNVVNLRRRF